MSVVYLLIPLAIVLMLGAGAALIWAVNSGQFDDLDEAGHLALEPDAPNPPPEQTEQTPPAAP